MKTAFNHTNTLNVGFSEIQTILKKSEDEVSNTGNPHFFKVRTANQCLKDASLLPAPSNLFMNLWFENELCILFADTNVGKSILAVQMGDEIAALKKSTVLYFDFELTDKQFEKRYSEDFSKHFRFNPNFYRIEINTDFTDYDDFEKQINRSVEDVITRFNSKIIILDNITFLRSTTETAREALPMMKQLKMLKNKYSLSILVLAHTPKRDASRLLSINDLQGSKMLSNFADSIFAIGVSAQDTALRYIKQFKSRSSEIFYQSDSVLLCEIVKHTNFLCFEFLETADERDHLKIPEKAEKEILDELIIALRRDNPEMSLSIIAKKADTNKMRVKRVLERNQLKS
jgi:hypothetical protein